MALNKQIFCYSVGTDSFYEQKEIEIHKRLLDLYTLRKNLKNNKLVAKNPVPIDTKFWLRTINKVIEEEKESLVSVLNDRLLSNEPRELRKETLKDKNIVSLFESTLTRALGIETNALTNDLIILNVFFFQVFHSLVRDGFIYNGEKYIFLTASAGQIRKKMGMFIREEAYKSVSTKLMCGLTIDKINECGGINPNKFLAYLALNNSATDVWEDFDIDRAIVVEDFETFVETEVDYVDDVTYEVERRIMPVFIPHTDGCGMVDGEKTRMVRMPWVKGLLIDFRFNDWVREKCPNGKARIFDIYGKEYNLPDDNIKYIFTKSQFKLYQYYKSWEEYKKYFKQYKCEPCFCNIEEDYIPSAKINYQMLQTLSDCSTKEIKKIISRTAEDINKIGEDFAITMKLLGATKYNQSPNYFQQGLLVYPELFRDVYHKEILKQTKKSLVKQAKAGRLSVNGKYQFLSTDLYAFCEWLFLGIQNPKGILENGEVYSSINKNDVDLACLRSPHLYREWAIRKNNKTEEANKWFSNTSCLYTSTHDAISKILQFDVDGDKSLVIEDKLITDVAKRNMENIVPLYYDMKTAKPLAICNEVLYDGMIKAFTSGNIGIYSNNISKIWNSGEIGEEQLRVIKMLCMENNFVIDCAKTLYVPTRPKEKDEEIKKYTKSLLPEFFIYAKDKTKDQVEKSKGSTMNRITEAIPTSRIKYCKTIAKFDYRNLMNKEVDFTVKETPIIDKYNYWVSHRYFPEEINEDVKEDGTWIFQQIRNDILQYGSLDYVVNTLVNYCYTVKKGSNKKILWSCFGDVLVQNLKINLKNSGKICPCCGKRFKTNNTLQTFCSVECKNRIGYRISKNSAG